MIVFCVIFGVKNASSGCVFYLETEDVDAIVVKVVLLAQLLRVK